MISPSDRAKVKALIEAQISELEESIPRMEERSSPVSPDAAIGRLSRTDSMMNAGTIGLWLREAQARLTRLRNRLAKIDAITFDECAKCGGKIEMERLMVVPDRGICQPCLATLKR